MIVVVAGATGHLGTELLAELRRRGHTTRALTRRNVPLDADEVVVADAETDDLRPACRGADAVISALGATSRVDRGPRRPFRDTDTKPNLRLLAAAEEEGVARFAYVSVLNADRFPRNPYCAAHEAVVDALRASPVAHTIIRANGFFSAYDELLDLARRNRARLIGDPAARSNPIHDADLAIVCVAALEDGAEEVAVGGPESLTRLEETKLAYAAVGQPDRKIGRLPTPLLRGLALLIRPVDPRRAALLNFLADICTTDMVAPAHGERRLGDYLASRAAATPRAPGDRERNRTDAERSGQP